MRSFSTSFVALVVVPSALAACGGSEGPGPAVPASSKPAASASASAPAGALRGTAALLPSGSAGSQKAERRTSPGWSACHEKIVPDASELTQQVDALAKACAETTGMHPIAASKGAQDASNPPQAFGFKAVAGHCYRAYAIAETTITDLDLLIKDSTGAVAGEDSTDDPTPVVLENGAVCFSQNDDANVMVSVGAGKGGFAVQVWSD